MLHASAWLRLLTRARLGNGIGKAFISPRHFTETHRRGIDRPVSGVFDEPHVTLYCYWKIENPCTTLWETGRLWPAELCNCLPFTRHSPPSCEGRWQTLHSRHAEYHPVKPSRFDAATCEGVFASITSFSSLPSVRRAIRWLSTSWLWSPQISEH